MSGSNSREAHLMQGWVSAIGLGVLTCGIALFAYGLSWFPAILMGMVVALIIGLVFSFAMGGAPDGDATQQPASTPAPVADGTLKEEMPQAAPAPAKTSPAAAPKAEAPAESPAPAPAADAPAPAPAAAPEQPAPASASTAAPAQPTALDAPQGAADDLKQINGVGPVLEGKLNKLGIYHFWQIAGWSQAEIDWVDATLNFKGRIGRDNWITQAQRLAQQSPAKPG